MKSNLLYSGMATPALRGIRVLSVLFGLALPEAARAVPLRAVEVLNDPVAPPLAVPGTGLCAAYRTTDQPARMFPQEIEGSDFRTFPEGVNTFFEGMIGGPRVERTLTTRFDLSNGFDDVMRGISSKGDFTRAELGCPESGCPFPVGDSITPSLGARFRGFINIPVEWAGQPLHFGFFTDDAVAMVLFDKSGGTYYVASRGPTLGAAQWRITNQVVFKKPGLYPVEVVFAQFIDAAALEWSIFLGPFSDFERSAALGMKLSELQFALAEPRLFFQEAKGDSPFPDVNRCQQCPRKFANAEGNGTCPPGMFCNEAAVCATCRQGKHCGSECKPCDERTPVCVDINGQQRCVECAKDEDCRFGYRCNLQNYTCNECNVDADCPRGRRCDMNRCLPCATRTQCAGNSCNCCPEDAPLCVSTTMGSLPTCTECETQSDCGPGKQCDLVNRRCVEKIPDCNTDDRCGLNCVPCPQERPHCLNGQVCVVCTSDLDCGAGRSCLSGDCVPCTSDRRCGSTCRSCGGDTPFCKAEGGAENARCVRCLEDSQCGDAGRCDTTTNTCIGPGCPEGCPAGQHCDGRRCVECYANTHCPCGGSCNVSIGTCSEECSDTSDCLGTQCCVRVPSEGKMKCQPGRCKPGVRAHGGALCCEAAPLAEAGDPGVVRSGAQRSAAILALAVALLALFAHRRRRRAA